MEALVAVVEEEDGEEILVVMDEVQVPVATQGQEIRLWPTTSRSTCRLTLFRAFSAREISVREISSSNQLASCQA